MVDANYVKLDDPNTASDKGFMVTNSLIEKGNIFNTSKNANTDYFAQDIIPTLTPTTFRVQTNLGASAILSVKRTVGEDTVTDKLNGGVALTSGCLYIFDIIVNANETINFQADTTNTVGTFSVNEVVTYV